MLANEQLLAQQLLGEIGRSAQHVAHGEEARLVVDNNAAVRRDVYLAVAEGIKGIKGLVGRHSRGQVDEYLGFGGGVVFHLLGLYLAFLDSFEYRVDKRCGGLGVGNLADNERLVVCFLYFRLERSAALAVVVFQHVNAAAGGEVGVEREIFAAQITDCSVAKLVEVMWKYL